MRQETRFKFNAYLSRVAELNGIDAGDVSKKFTVEPSVTQTLMNTMQESSDFLTRINIVPVSEMKGEKIGIGVTGPIASTTDTAGGTERQPKDFSKLASNKYECDQVNFDFYIRYKTLDLWARYQDFQLRIRNAIIKRQSLDLIMAGFNGVRRAETSDRSSNPMLQDVAVGWLQKYRNEAPARVMSKVTDEEGHTTSEVIRVGKSGADKNGILAQTPAILNMSLANKKTMEENATLLIGTKSAFGLADDKASHIADVISMTMNKSQATFEGLSDSLTYVGPVAKDAGVSLEETAAMLGALHDANISGSMAGTGSRAVLSRLQAPTGKAYDAIKELGVKTTDSKGNTRPVFSILKEIQRSFEKNKLGTGQRAEYMKTIFGEEASSSASVLMTAAASGKLDNLTRLIKESDGKTEELVKVMQDNLGGDFKSFQSAYQAVGTDLFDQQEGALRNLTQTATKYVLKLDGWIQKNKSLASTIGLIVGGALALIGVIGAIGLVAWPVITGINAIIAAASAMGAIFTTVGSAVMTAIGAISWPVVAVVAAIVAGALLIRKYWEPVSAFFGGVVEGLKAAFAPVGELFTPLKPVFDWLGEKLQAAWQWFKNLIAPVKATQDTLNRCRDTGVMFGQALADALMLPLNAFNKLRSGIDWVLEKLGVINKESDTLDQTAARTHAATYGTGGYIPATSSYAGYQAYQPVTAPAGRSYVDQSKNEYHISLTGGTAPGTQLDRQLQDALEKYERDKRARARASMMHDG